MFPLIGYVLSPYYYALPTLNLSLNSKFIDESTKFPWLRRETFGIFRLSGRIELGFVGVWRIYYKPYSLSEIHNDQL